MSRKVLIALATISAIGAAALVPTAASAYGRGANMHNNGGNKHFGGRTAFRNPGFRNPGFRGQRPPRIVYRPHVPHYPPHVVWHRPYVPVVPVSTVATTSASYAVAPVEQRCTCLTKEYTPDGSVLFKDVCTKESALSPAPAAQYAPPAPTAQYAPQYAPAPQQK